MRLFFIGFAKDYFRYMSFAVDLAPSAPRSRAKYNPLESDCGCQSRMCTPALILPLNTDATNRPVKSKISSAISCSSRTTNSIVTTLLNGFG